MLLVYKKYSLPILEETQTQKKDYFQYLHNNITRAEINNIAMLTEKVSRLKQLSEMRFENIIISFL